MVRKIVLQMWEQVNYCLNVSPQNGCFDLQHAAVCFPSKTLWCHFALTLSLLEDFNTILSI